MGFRPFHLRFGLARAAFMACCSAFWIAHAEELKDPTPATPVSTNAAPQPAARRDTLKELENDLVKPFKQLTPGTRINQPLGRSLLQSRSSAPTKRERELLERKKNWIFLMEPDNLSSGLNEKEIFRMKGLSPEDQEKEKLSPMERYYQNLQRHSSSSTGANKNDDGSSLAPVSPTSPRNLGEDGDERLPAFVRETARTLRKLSNAEVGAESQSKEGGRPKSNGSSIFSDIFGSGSKIPSHSEVEAQKARMDEYRQIVGGPTVSPTSPNSLNPVSSLINTKPQPVAPYLGIVNTSSSSPQQTGPVQSGTIGGFRIPGSIPDLAVKSLPMPSLTPEVPKYEQPKVTPPNPTFSAPRRVFP